MPIEGLARSHSPFLFLNHRRHSPSCAEPGTGCHHFLGTRGYFGRRSRSLLQPAPERRGEGRRGCGAAPGLGSPPTSPSRSLLLLALGCQMLQPGSAQLSLEEIRRRFRRGLYIGRASWLGFTHRRRSRKLPGKDFLCHFSSCPICPKLLCFAGPHPFRGHPTAAPLLVPLQKSLFPLLSQKCRPSPAQRVPGEPRCVPSTQVVARGPRLCCPPAERPERQLNFMRGASKG